MVAVVSASDPFKYAESNQTANSMGKVGVSGSVSLSFSSPASGVLAVTNLSAPILITIPHPPLLDNSTVECRFWDPILLEQSTEGCELVASFANYSVCACDHLTAFSMGRKIAGLRVQPPLLYTLYPSRSSPLRSCRQLHSTHGCLHLHTRAKPLSSRPTSTLPPRTSATRTSWS